MPLTWTPFTLKWRSRIKKTNNHFNYNNSWLKTPNENDDFDIFLVKRYWPGRFLLEMKITTKEDD